MEDSVHKSEMASLEAWYATSDSRMFQGLGMHGFSCKMMALYGAKGWRTCAFSEVQDHMSCYISYF